MSRSPGGHRRFNDYRPLPPPSPQSKSERLNAAKFADELFLQEESTMTPTGSAPPEVILQSRSPSRAVVSPRRQSASRIHAEFTTGVRLHSRAASYDRGHSAPRRLYHDPLDAALNGAIPEDESPAPVSRPASGSAVPRRYASAPRASLPGSHTRPHGQDGTSPPSHSRPRSASNSRPSRRGPRRAPVLQAPVTRQVQRPSGYRSYTRDTFASRQLQREKVNGEDDILAKVLQRPPWNPGTTPTREAHPLHWTLGVHDHSDDDGEGADLNEEDLFAQPPRSRRRGSAERGLSGRRRRSVSPTAVKARLPSQAPTTPPGGRTGGSRRAPPRDVHGDVYREAGGDQPNTRQHDWRHRHHDDRDNDLANAYEAGAPGRSPFQAREAQLLGEILDEVERLRGEAKEYRRQLRECRRREKSYLLHIQALERVLAEHVPSDVPAIATSAPQPRHPQHSNSNNTRSAAPATVTAWSAEDTTMQSLTLSPVPRTSPQPLPSTDATPAKAPTSSSHSAPHHHDQKRATQTTPSVPADGVDSLLEKLNKLKAIEHQLRDELRGAVSQRKDTSEAAVATVDRRREHATSNRAVAPDVPHNRRLQEERLLAQPHPMQGLSASSPPRHVRADPSAAYRASLLAQYRHAQPPPFISAATGWPAQHVRALQSGSFDLVRDEGEDEEGGDRQPRQRTDSADYAVRVHHSHHMRGEQDSEKNYTLGVQGDLQCMSVPPVAASRSAKTGEVAAAAAATATEKTRTTPRNASPPPPLFATVAALRDDACRAELANGHESTHTAYTRGSSDPDHDASAATDDHTAAEAARRERARERALLLQSLEVSPTRRNTHLHNVRKNDVARPLAHAPPTATIEPSAVSPAPPHKAVEGSDEDVGQPAEEEVHTSRAVSEYEMWRSFNEDGIEM